ncbi:hypothetical protein ACFYU5_33285 [Nocardia aobensis]|uniref:Uncharacterized protein n=1 Tax=Nocardia aobensis TaxID=257277 RepID=A0ABW6PDR3_9NOCA
MTVTVERLTSEELRRRREDLLAGVGLTYREISDLASRYMLTPEELAAWDEIRSVEFLLDDA